MGNIWTLESIGNGHAVLRSGDLLGTLYAPDGDGGAYVDVDKGINGGYRPVLSMPEAKAHTWLKGEGRRSVHRPAVTALLTQWPANALAACMHAVHGKHGLWCTHGACPLAGLDSTTAQAG